MIDVVAALFKDKDKVLIAKRLKGKYAGMWEFPGGKVEKGEKSEETLKREIKEELNLDIKKLKFITQIEYEYPDIKLNLILYEVIDFSGDLILNDHSEVKWVKKEDLRNYDLLPADVKLLEIMEI